VSVYEKLGALNITLPELTPPVAAFVPFLRTGNLPMELLNFSEKYLEIADCTYAARSGWRRFRLGRVWKLNWSRSFSDMQVR